MVFNISDSVAVDIHVVVAAPYNIVIACYSVGTRLSVKLVQACIVDVRRGVSLARRQDAFFNKN